jgi:DNA-binding Xre family transcriptional regulator
MISYDKLWDTMRRKGVSQYRLIKNYNVSPGQIGRLKKNRHCSTHTLERLCEILECNIGDIIEYKP